MQPTLRVARELLGCTIVVRHGRSLRRGIIVDTEAYVGPRDLASHASRGLTPRTRVMFGPPGRLYVYLVYGLHYCLNVVTERAGYPAAVLIRALAPRERRPVKMVRPDQNDWKRIGARGGGERVVVGPGRVARYLGVDRRLNYEDVVTSRRVWCERGPDVPARLVRRGPRIGVAYAQAWQHKLWRFTLVGIKKRSGS